MARHRRGFEHRWNVEGPRELAAERGTIGDVIMPHSTRKRIAPGLAMLRGKKVEMPARKHDKLILSDNELRVTDVNQER